MGSNLRVWWLYSSCVGFVGRTWLAYFHTLPVISHSYGSAVLSDCSKQRGQRQLSSAFASVISCILIHGEGLWIGPDSDGLLNICNDDDVR